MRPDQLERRLRARLDALDPARRAELLHVLTLPTSNRRTPGSAIVDAKLPPYLRKRLHEIPLGPEEALA